MQNDGRKIVKEAFSSEAASLLINIIVGILLTFLILPRASFGQLIIMIPAMLSVRGNISGSYSARIARDLIIGSARKNLKENILSTITLTFASSTVIGVVGLCIAFVLHGATMLPVLVFFLLPLFTMLMTLAISIPSSTALNFLAFKKGLNPSNVVPPIMTSIDDVLIVINLFITITILGVP